MKGDTFLRVPYASYALAKAYAATSGRQLREIAATALTHYVEREEHEHAHQTNIATPRVHRPH